MVDFVWELMQANNLWKRFTLPPEQCLLIRMRNGQNHRLPSWEADVEPAVFGAFGRLTTVQTLTGDPSQLLRFFLGGASDTFDVRNLPPGLYARVVEPPRFVGQPWDDRRFRRWGHHLLAEGRGHRARANGQQPPPHFAPDQGLAISLAADGLADRTMRAEVRDPAWVSGDQSDQTELEIQDMVARAFETMGLANIDETNDAF